MKLHYVAAATLLIGTSALAWAPSSVPVAAAAEDPIVSAGTAKKDSKVDLVSKSNDLPTIEDQAAVPDMPKVQPAAAVTWDEPEATAKPEATAQADPDLDLAVDPATVDDGTTGMGGPLESAEAAAPTGATDLAPHPAAQNYPPCRPGPGDDNCIQLYEPGVRTALASWVQPTGGVMNESAQAGMGGPYEPVDDDAATATADAYAGDGIVSPGEPADAEA